MRPAQTNLPTATPSPSALVSSATPPGEFNWANRVGSIRYAKMPTSQRGEWVLRAALDANSVLVALIPNGSSPAIRESQRSELARVNLENGTVKTLVELSPGTQVIGPIAVRETIAWVEAGALELRAYGWKIHVTDALTGSDRVIATDPGLRIDQSTSVVPAIAFDGTTLLYSILAQTRSGMEWQLRRLRDGRDDVIASLPDAQARRFMRLAVDDRGAVWSEAVLAPQLATEVAILDETGPPFRKAISVSNIYQIVLVGERVVLATDAGLMGMERSVPSSPRRVSREVGTIAQIARLGDYILYRNFDSAESVAAVDMRSGEHALIGTGATFGPIEANGAAVWFERASGTTDARIGRSAL
jgi:hypothetical protein